ncbi:Triacylglycerol lipase obl1 [Castilleja foliolosa]|uniref:Triacylglycerol lipase obl1 n=1 Tax=Castilleja foliolosa TaxID=1961234 RepID=A0ABD3EMN6_9LAMI
MASKLAYENDKVVKNVVDLHWKMHFVAFYNCWNDYQKDNSTQVFIMCDKPIDASVIFISFRGTEPFDADDWITDFDYSWYEIPKLGKVHMGFLEALGLGNRVKISTFSAHLKNVNSSRLNGFNSDSTEKELIPTMVEKTAYYSVKSQLKDLLVEHKNAKFVVTGHSLGGALAILFPTVLVLHEEEEVMQRLLGVYTFGQPRIGDGQLGRYMEAHLEQPESKYFRVVYCNDLVPRLPYDDKTFLYKHFGVCLYYNSIYVEKNVDEEPNRNYFGWRFLIPEYLNSVWELLRSLTMGYICGPDYKESWESLMLRIIGLAIPGLSDHSPVDYVNSVRLGRRRSLEMMSL